LSEWPFPRWIAHRGAGKLAPENTLLAFRQGLAHGYRMFECDVKLSADGVPFLLHDATLERTTNGQGRAGVLDWNALSRLDAGSWHSAQAAGETLPSLAAVARLCIANHAFLNIEIKANPGDEARTGEVVSNHAAQLWRDQPVGPLLSSFDTASLAAAQAAQPGLPRAYLIDHLREIGWDERLEQAQALGCKALVCNYALWNAERRAQTRERGLRALSYTVNTPEELQRLRAPDIDLDGIITDRIDLFTPD